MMKRPLVAILAIRMTKGPDESGVSEAKGQTEGQGQRDEAQHHQTLLTTHCFAFFALYFVCRVVN